MPRYGKKKYIPPQCPECGDKLAEWESGNLSSLFKVVYGRWHAEFRKRDPVWKIPQWYGVCGNCASLAALNFKGETFWDKVAKTGSEWKGGTITIPFTKR